MKKRTKFIPDEKFWADNGKEFPEVRVKGTMLLDWSNYINLEDFQKFINYYSDIIKEPSDLSYFCPSLYRRAKDLHILKNLTYERRLKDWSSYMTLEDFQKFIDSRDDITCSSEFRELEPGLSNRAIRLGFYKQLKFKSSNRNLSYFDTIDKFQNFINQNDIKSPSEFANIDKSLWCRAQRLGFLKDLNYVDYIRSPDYSLINTLEEFQNFIDEHQDINRPSDLMNNYSGLYDKASKLGFLENLKYKFRFNDKNWSEVIKSKEDLINFIKSNNILNSTDLMLRFPGLRTHISRHICQKAEEFNQAFSNPKLSFLERKTKLFLEKNNISFNFQHCIKNLGKLRFDFWIPESKLILEPGGKQHLIPDEHFGGIDDFKIRRNNDLIKFNYCKENDITVLYWFSDVSKANRELIEDILNKEGYFGEYYLDFDEFCNRILEIVGQKK